jgi:hypothetical protein
MICPICRQTEDTNRDVHVVRERTGKGHFHCPHCNQILPETLEVQIALDNYRERARCLGRTIRSEVLKEARLSKHSDAWMVREERERLAREMAPYGERIALARLRSEVTIC